jgi:hypothetical protein
MEEHNGSSAGDESFSEKLTTCPAKWTQFEFLGAHGAPEEFVKLSNKLSELKAQAQKIRDYRELLETYREQMRELTISLENENTKAASYHAKRKVSLKRILRHSELFRGGFIPISQVES